MGHVDARGEHGGGIRRHERSDDRFAGHGEGVRRADLCVVGRVRREADEGLRNRRGSRRHTVKRHGEERRGERRIRPYEEQQVRPRGIRRHPGVHAERTDGHDERRVGVGYVRSSHADLRLGRRSVGLRRTGRQERGVVHRIVFGLRPIRPRNRVEQTALVDAADEGCLIRVLRIVADAESHVVVRRGGTACRRHHLDAVLIEGRRPSVVDDEQVFPSAAEASFVGSDVVLGGTSGGNGGVFLPDQFPAVVVFPVFLPRNKPGVLGGLGAAHVEPAGDGERVTDGLRIVGGRLQIGTSRRAVRALAAIPDRTRNGDGKSRSSPTRRHGVERVSRRIGDRSARLGHVPNANVAGKRTLVADDLAARRAAPAHDELGAVGHRREPHPDERRAVRVPGVDLERQAGPVHADESDVRAGGLRVKVVVGEPGRRVLGDADEHREAGKRRRARVAGDGKQRALVECSRCRPRQCLCRECRKRDNEHQHQKSDSPSKFREYPINPIHVLILIPRDSFVSLYFSLVNCYALDYRKLIISGLDARGSTAPI